MSGIGFAIGLACAALGLGISAAPSRQRWMLLGLLFVVLLIAGHVSMALALQPVALKALGVGTIVTAALAYFGSRASLFWGLATLSLGLWLGILFQAGVASSGDLALGLACVLLFIPADFLRARGLQVATYVVASWIVTAGFIYLVFALLKPAGPIMDHML